MERKTLTFEISEITDFKIKLLHWAQQFNAVIWLDSNNYHQEYSNFDAVLGVDVASEISSNTSSSFEELRSYQQHTEDFIFGYMGYDLKNNLEQLESQNFDGLEFPDLYFFQPKKLFFLKGNTVSCSYLLNISKEIEDDFEAIKNMRSEESISQVDPPKIKLRIHKDAYFSKLKTVLDHIHRGDIYEANFCQEFYSEDCNIDPLMVYLELNTISKPPFATFFKKDQHYLLSASPERYLMKTGDRVISQPIKGTEKRADSIEEDKKLIANLEQNPKERAENIMIVDLVRNDLSRKAIKGTVHVEELCKVYTFQQVHQLISTISCKVAPDLDPVDLIEATFPMGSMTGAPKISAMKIIEKVEETKRGLFSGTVGYFSPKGDFDFNVIIRSILYNGTKKYLSFSVGGAITAQSIPENEYEECLLKAKAMKQVLLNC